MDIIFERYAKGEDAEPNELILASHGYSESSLWHPEIIAKFSPVNI